ncbi:hypothetical protein [Streptomyces sp. NRRL S-495]|uniref:hypothetical protein n=1 Tax=Streptomyces sp. NRRL S-495 TaxID=1609133 RepID=UPI0005F92E89|nr:hypothetical protein [Streptomyces sp. NRRL S-495]KJY38132.1 hypothetical protein VR45_06815 [Streptomyces sp. NRRL S-495]
MSTLATTQVTAAGALLAILSAHRTLPTPAPELMETRLSGGDLAWGVRLSLHNGLDHFERWRAALGLPTADVDHRHSRSSTLAWLIVTGTVYGVPVELVGFYDPADTGEEELS